MTNDFLFFFFFWLCWVFVAERGLSLVVTSRGYSSLRCAGFSSWWLLLLWSTGTRRVGFSSCGSCALERRLSSLRTGLVALPHVGSSRTRARTCVPCFDRWILNHCTTREVPVFIYFFFLESLIHSTLVIIVRLGVFLKFIYFIYLLIYWLRWVFVAVCGLSLVAASGGYSSLRCTGFSSRWLFLLWRTGFSSCGTQAQ